MNRLSNLVRAFVKEDDGAAIAEYGLLLAIVAIGAITVLIAFRTQLEQIFVRIGTGLESMPDAPAAP